VIRAQLVLDDDGMLVRMSVTGHAHSSSAGNDLVCAAVSSLVRTTVRTLEAHEGLRVWYNAPGPGTVALDIETVPQSEKIWLKGVTDMVRIGFEDIRSDAPAHIELDVKRSNSNGT